MLFSTADQGSILLLMLGAGVLVGAWYHLLSLVRRLLEAGFFLSLAADLAFGLGAAAILTSALVAANYGQARPYMFLAAALGAGLYSAGVARPLRTLLRGLYRRGRGLAARLKDNRLIKVIFR